MSTSINAFLTRPWLIVVACLMSLQGFFFPADLWQFNQKLKVFHGHRVVYSTQNNATKHRRRKYGGSSPNSLRPISYFGSCIWELYVLDPKNNVCCKKKIQLHFPMNKGLTVPIVWLETAKIPHKISAQFVCPSPKVSNFWKKALSGCPLSVQQKNLRILRVNVFL